MADSCSLLDIFGGSFTGPECGLLKQFGGPETNAFGNQNSTYQVMPTFLLGAEVCAQMREVPHPACFSNLKAVRAAQENSEIFTGSLQTALQCACMYLLAASRILWAGLMHEKLPYTRVMPRQVSDIFSNLQQAGIIPSSLNATVSPGSTSSASAVSG